MPSSQLSVLARELRGSSILEIAGEIRALAAAGHSVLDLTVGDFSARQFRIPPPLETFLTEALRAGETTYPPAAGLDRLRQAVADFHARRLGRPLEPANVLVAAGARPAIYALYCALVDRGDRVVFGVPGWNNDFYCAMVGAAPIAVACEAANGFLPTAEGLRPYLRGARLLALNSPLNPSGSAFTRAQLTAICDAVVEENQRRGADERPLYLFYDQIYWQIASAGVECLDPVSLRPELEPYTVSVDGISKAFAATGLRVGWAIGPVEIIRAMNNFNGHVGAWAPRPEQVATARLLADEPAIEGFLAGMRSALAERLDVLYTGLSRLRGTGLAVEALKPQGAIYASVQFPLHGCRTPEGAILVSDEDIRRYLLRAAGVAVVPFTAFGAPPGTGWFRMSVGAVSVAELKAMMPRLMAALARLHGTTTHLCGDRKQTAASLGEAPPG